MEKKAIIAILAALLCAFVIITSSMTIYTRNTFKKYCSNAEDAEENTNIEGCYQTSIAFLVISILVFVSLVVFMYYYQKQANFQRSTQMGRLIASENTLS